MFQASWLSNVSNLCWGPAPDRTVFYINTGQSIPCGRAAVHSAGWPCIMYSAAAAASTESFHVKVRPTWCMICIVSTCVHSLFTFRERDHLPARQTRPLRSCSMTFHFCEIQAQEASVMNYLTVSCGNVKHMNSRAFVDTNNHLLEPVHRRSFSFKQTVIVWQGFIVC